MLAVAVNRPVDGLKMSALAVAGLKGSLAAVKPPATNTLPLARTVAVKYIRLVDISGRFFQLAVAGEDTGLADTEGRGE
jgi:hypothetical protein